MWYANYKSFKEIIEADMPLATKIFLFESDVSEITYRLWCRIIGGRFELRKKERQNSCVLVTKRGFHLISTFLAKRISLSISPSTLEAYQMDCPEKNPYGLGKTAYYYRFIKSSNCEDCGRCYEVQESDKKIIGKF